MKRDRLQCKDIPIRPILELLEKFYPRWTTHYDCGWDNSISSAFPTTEINLVRAKLSSLKSRGLVDGCDCGCRGDWVITDKGREWLNKERSNA